MRNTHQRHGFYFMSKPLGGTAPFGKFSDLQVVVHPGAQQVEYEFFILCNKDACFKSDGHYSPRS